MGKKQDKQALAAYQMASMLGSAGGMFGYHNPAQAQFAASMTDNAKGSIAAQTAYMQAKKQKEKESSGIGALAGTLAGAALAAPTGGMSLAAGAALGGGIGGAAENVGIGNYTGAGQSLATGLSSYAAAGAPTGTGGTLEPVEKAAETGASLLPLAGSGSMESTPSSIAAAEGTPFPKAPVGGTSPSPNLATRKEGLAKLDFKGADQVQQHGYMSVMLDAGVQPTRQQWNAMSPADQKYWESRGVTPPRSAWAGVVDVLRQAFPAGGTR